VVRLSNQNGGRAEQDSPRQLDRSTLESINITIFRNTVVFNV
jgi:hypothetical protein